MTVDRRLPAQLFEKLYVNRQGRQPLRAADNVSGPHKVVVHNVGKMICRNARSLENYRILVVCRHVQSAADCVLHMDSFYLILRQTHVPVGFKPDYIRLSGFDVFLNLLIGKRSALCKLAVYSRCKLHFFLLAANFSNFFFCKEARISLAFPDQLLGKTLIYFASAALCVIAVAACIAVHCGAFVKIDAEEPEGIYDDLNGPLHKALVVSVLNSKIENTPRLVSQPLVHKGSVKVSQMDEACRARAQPGHLSPFRKLPRRVHGLVVLRCSGYVRKKQLRQFLIVHMLILRFLLVIKVFLRRAAVTL